MKEHEKEVREVVVVGMHAVKENKWVGKTVSISLA
jgi:hypothetical protein